MQETQKYYEQDAYRRECDAVLLAAEAVPGGVRLALDATVFYPEGGGQPADRGMLTFAGGAAAAVTDVHTENGVIWHLVPALPAGIAAGAAVHAAIDWERRFDHMQQHTGEHILSGTLHRLYGAENVGFHIGAEIVRMDTSIPLSAGQLRAAETAANAVIWADAPVQAQNPEPAQLARMTYRSKKALEGPVRIVTIPGADVCACCGTHTATAGQVGLVIITASEHYKGGERLTVLCGARALREMQAMRAREQAIGALLSAKSSETAAAVQRVYGEYTALKFAHYGMAGRLFAALAAAAAPGVPAIEILPDLTPDELHRLAETLGAQEVPLAAALTPSGKGTGYALASRARDVRPLAKALNTAFAGRGGGKPQLCQGSCAAGTPEQLAAFLRTYEKENPLS